MRTTYYVATSLDGYIATPDGGVDWLSFVNVDGATGGYNEFFDSVDGLVMGRRSFDQVQGFGVWPYQDKPCWVMTSRQLAQPVPSSVIPSGDTPGDILASAKAKGLAHLWIVGGAGVASSFLEQNCLDRLVVSVLPTVISEGIPLFSGPFDQRILKLSNTVRRPGDIVQLTYEVNTSD